MERQMRPADDDRELEELDRAYSEITGYKPKKTKNTPKKRNNLKILLTICILNNNYGIDGLCEEVRSNVIKSEYISTCRFLNIIL